MAPVLLLLIAAATPLEEGVDLYHAFEFEQAVFRFQRAAVEPGIGDDARATALVWLGMSQAAVGDLGAARGSFLEGCRLIPALALPEAVSPKVGELFTEACAEAARTAAPQKPPPPPPPPPPVAGGTGGLPPLAVAGGAIAAVGIAAGATAGVLYAVALDRVAFAQRPDTFQDDAATAVDEANAQAIAALALAGVGGVAVLGGGVALALGFSE